MAKKIPVFVIIALVLVLLVLGASRMGFPGLNSKEYTFNEDETALNNPCIGYAPEADYVSLGERYRLVYMNLLWSELEPQEGEYNWDYIEEKYNLKRWRREGKNLILRFVCDIPSKEEHMDIPQWLYDKTGDGEFYDIEYGFGYCPDYNNEVFIEAHNRAVAEIGRHFAEDDFLSYVELGSLGHWGEWHTYYPAGLPRIPKTDVRKKYVDAYTQSFPYAKLMMRRPFAEMPEGYGVFNDMTGASQDTFAWLQWINRGGDYDSSGEKGAIKAVPEIWKKAPVGGEFTSSIPISTMLTDDLDETLKMLEESHMSFIGPKIPNVVKNADIAKAADKVLSRVGYRYRIAGLSLKTPFLSKETELKLTLTNDGVAPIYFEYTPCVYVELPEGADKELYESRSDGYGLEGTDAEGMLRFEIPLKLQEICGGETRQAQLDLPKELLGTTGVRMYAGIEDPVTKMPEILLGMDRERKGMLSLLWQK
jgi:hypothetical protein